MINSFIYYQSFIFNISIFQPLLYLNKYVIDLNYLMNFLLKAFIMGFIMVSCNKIECKENNCNGPVTLELDPVCGCNNITYPNPSTAECHGITYYHRGECNNN